MSKKLSLSEIMGKAGASKVAQTKLSMDHLPDLLGDGLQDIPINSVGRYRLMNALKGRFGNGYRNIPGVQDIIKDFDSRLDLETRVYKLREIKYKPKDKK